MIVVTPPAIKSFKFTAAAAVSGVRLKLLAVLDWFVFAPL